MLDRQTLVFIVLGTCIVNGIFSPYLKIAIPISAALMPELFPRTIEWVLFWASILLATATLLFSGIPAALYERLVARNPEDTVSMWIWLAGAMLLTLPAFVRVL
jgi:heme/copper-type cytochrome/quinol oxidase subunit 3